MAAAYDFADARTVVDVGGGSGALLPAILQRHPELQGIVFDRLQLCRRRRRVACVAAGVADRCRFVAGDFFARVLDGAEVYLLKSVIHDWGDARAGAILRVCRAAMPRAARLLLVEVVMPARLGCSPLDQMIAGTDLNMLVMTGGRERTEAEYRALCADAALRVARVIPSATAFSLIEAVPA
ncbi:MAG: methyltransferase [Candidatus Binatia bacterium]